MDLSKIAARVASAHIARRKPKSRSKGADRSALEDQTEYSCRMEIELSADFEGSASKQALIKKFKNEVMAALETSMEICARDLELDATSITIRPLRMDCTVTEPDED